jgi:alkylated DNA repair protein (DNA oxidative demethylase)
MITPRRLSTRVDLPAGVRHFPGHLDAASQRALRTDIEAVIAAAPLFTPAMPRTGRPFSVAITNCGTLGWLSDQERGYRYEPRHPTTGRPWPAIPTRLLRVWRDVADCDGNPEACLINMYRHGARMGSHRDADEDEPAAPVVSVSLGDDAVFHVGGTSRGGPKARVTLRSGDVIVFGGPSRFIYHGIDRVLPGTSDLIAGGGRINLTMRRVTPFG